MKYLPPNTLAYYQAAPHFKMQEVGALPVTAFAEATLAYRTHVYPVTVRPGDEAINFYGLNHCAALVRERFTPNEPLPVWAQQVMQAYILELARQTERLVHYNISICTREMRAISSPSLQLIAKLKLIHPRLPGFIQSLSKVGEDAALGRYYASGLGDCSVTQYMQGMMLAFSKAGGGKFSTCYGGDPWSDIAKCLWMALSGQTSLELMVDTSYTLAHNTCSMFNKPLLYQFHNGSDGQHLLQILDVQRSGQIPEMVLDPKHWTSTNIAALTCTPIIKRVLFELPGVFGTYVDWFKVEALGSVAKYPMQQAWQQVAYPAVKAVQFNGRPATVTGNYHVWPGQTVPVVQREAV